MEKLCPNRGDTLQFSRQVPILWITCCLHENCAVIGYYTDSSGNSLPTFRDNLSVPSSRVFSYLPTLRQVVPKRRYGITTTRYLITQQSTVLIYFAVDAWNHACCIHLLPFWWRQHVHPRLCWRAIGVTPQKPAVFNMEKLRYKHHRWLWTPKIFRTYTAPYTFHSILLHVHVW